MEAKKKKKLGTCFRSELGSFSEGAKKERIGTNLEKTQGKGEQRTLGLGHPGPLGDRVWGLGSLKEFSASGPVKSDLSDADPEAISKSQ